MPPHPRPGRPLPTMRQKHNGAWFVRLAGKDHYLSMDPVAATAKYKALLAAHLVGVGVGAGEPVPESQGRPRRVVDVVQRFLQHYQDLDRAQAVKFATAHLKRFTHFHGKADIITLTRTDPARRRFVAPVVPLVMALQTDLKKRLGLANKTNNHDTRTIVRLFRWAARRGYCHRVEFDGLTSLPTRRGAPEDISPEDVAAMVKAAQEARPPERSRRGSDRNAANLAAWIALQYLCCLRTSEVPRLVAREGTMHPIPDLRGRPTGQGKLFSLEKHKSSWRNPNNERWIVLTPAALQWLERASPRWKENTYAQRAKEVTGRPPRVLRDSAATHLLYYGASREDVDLLLGHALHGESPSYARTPWPALLATAGLLKL